MILIHINGILLVMRLVVSLIIETEDREDLVVLLTITKQHRIYGLLLVSIYLKIGSSRHKTLRNSRSAHEALSKHKRLRSKHGKLFFGKGKRDVTWEKAKIPRDFLRSS